MLDHNTRYLQIAFNYDVDLVNKILPAIHTSQRIIIEAGTPLYKAGGCGWDPSY
jgi:3-keto-L-gulonate-6-phosphate decarboxylase